MAKEIQNLRDPTRINAVVVLTDGADNQSHTDQRSLVSELSRQGVDDSWQVRL